MPSAHALEESNAPVRINYDAASASSRSPARAGEEKQLRSCRSAYEATRSGPAESTADSIGLLTTRMRDRHCSVREAAAIVSSSACLPDVVRLSQFRQPASVSPALHCHPPLRLTCASYWCDTERRRDAAVEAMLPSQHRWRKEAITSQKKKFGACNPVLFSAYDLPRLLNALRLTSSSNHPVAQPCSSTLSLGLSRETIRRDLLSGVALPLPPASSGAGTHGYNQ